MKEGLMREDMWTQELHVREHCNATEQMWPWMHCFEIVIVLEKLFE